MVCDEVKSLCDEVKPFCGEVKSLCGEVETVCDEVETICDEVEMICDAFELLCAVPGKHSDKCPPLRRPRVNEDGEAADTYFKRRINFMTDLERNYYNAFVRIRDFWMANTLAIQNSAAAVANFQKVSTGVSIIESSGEVQLSGAIGAGVVQKDFALAELRAWMSGINRTARALAVDNPSVAELFRIPHNNNEQMILSAARAFLTNATPIKQQFIDFGMPANFLTELEADITAYADALTQKNEALDERVGATASVGATVRETLQAVRRLRGIVPNLFAGNAAKLAEWKSASHVEKLPRAASNGGTPTPNP